jgi:hypothetical protein
LFGSLRTQAKLFPKNLQFFGLPLAFGRWFFFFKKKEKAGGLIHNPGTGLRFSLNQRFYDSRPFTPNIKIFDFFVTLSCPFLFFEEKKDGKDRSRPGPQPLRGVVCKEIWKVGVREEANYSFYKLSDFIL